MERVVLAPGTEGLGSMLAGLVAGNIARHPDRVRFLHGVNGKVNVTASDVEVDVGLMFTGDALHIGAPFPDPDMTITTSSEILLSLTNVPLRFGMPDSFTPEGRRVAGMMLTGQLKVTGLPRHLKLMTRLQQLFSVT